MPLKAVKDFHKMIQPSDETRTIDSHVVGYTDPENPPKMTDADRERMGEMVRAMTEEEQMVVLENIPAERMIKIIELRLIEARAFRNAVEKTFNI